MRRAAPWTMAMAAVLTVFVSLQAQGAFQLTSTEQLALRLHGYYRQSVARLAALEADREKVRQAIREVAPAGLVPNPVAMEDAAELNRINDDIERERNRQRQLVDVWDKNRAEPGQSPRSFAFRYGPLESSTQASTANPGMDKIEYAIRTFRFDPAASGQPGGTLAPPTMPAPGAPPAPAARAAGSSPFDGTWHTTRTHTDGCGYSASEDLTFATGADGVTASTGSGFLSIARGRASGNSLTIQYGISGGSFTGTATLTVSPDGRRFTGTFSDKNNHRGNVSGQR